MSKKKILCIDDSVNLVQVLKKRFELELDVEVFTATDGESGLACAQEKVPDIIMLDINMPGMNGDEVLRRLKNEASLSDIPVIILTAHSEEDRAKYIAAGAAQYITSPFNTADLVQTVKQILEQS